MKQKIFIKLLLPFLVLSLISCAGMETNQGQGTAIGSGVGAGVGAIIGQAIGRNTEATLLGAGLGAALGGVTGNRVGHYMDQQEIALRNALQIADAASVRRDQDVLIATFRSETFFDYDSAILKPGAYAELSRVASVLNKYPQTRIRVEGHADSSGHEGYNQILSKNRAEAVKNGLIQRGVAPHRIMTIGYGETQQISSSRAMNRRVEIVIIPLV